MAAFSRHGGFFASLQRVEDRLALEEISDTMTRSASPLVLLDPATTDHDSSSSSSGPAALDFLTLTCSSRQEEEEGEAGDEDDDDEIPRLMALLGLSPPRDTSTRAHGDDDDSAGCDCSGATGFLGKVVGVVGPKCQTEKRRLDAWIHHFYHAGGRRRREPARLAHLLLAKASSADSSSSSSSHAPPFPQTVKELLDRDAPPPPPPPRCTD